MVINKVEKLKKELQQAEIEATIDQQNSDLKLWKNRLEDKVFLSYAKSFKQEKHIRMTWFQKVYISDKHRNNKEIMWDGEQLMFNKVNYNSTYSLLTNKQKHQPLPDFHLLTYNYGDTKTQVSIEDFKSLKSLTRRAVNVYIDDYLSGKKINFLANLRGSEYDEEMAIRKTYDKIDFPHIELNDQERFYIGHCTFMIGNCYLLTKNSLEYAINILREKIKSDNRSTTSLASLGYFNRHDKSSSYQELITKLQKTKY